MGSRGPKKGERPAGRQKGTPNKVPALLKDAIIQAAIEVGENGKGKDGLVGYLKLRAKTDPGPFMALMGKVLPLTIAGDPKNPLIVEQKEQAFRLLMGALQQAVGQDAPKEPVKVLELKATDSVPSKKVA